MSIQQVFGEGLQHRVAVYVVTEGLNAQAAQDIVKTSLAVMGHIFGGATAQEVLGSWVNDQGSLEIERVTLVYSAADNLSTDRLHAVRELARFLQSELNQVEIAVEVDGALYMVR